MLVEPALHRLENVLMLSRYPITGIDGCCARAASGHAAAAPMSVMNARRFIRSKCIPSPIDDCMQDTELACGRNDRVDGGS
jgi:hypothetical protein